MTVDNHPEPLLDVMSDTVALVSVGVGTVLGEEPTGGTQWTVVATDLRTGRRIWARPGGFDQYEVVAVAGDAATAGTAGSSSPAAHRARSTPRCSQWTVPAT